MDKVDWGKLFRWASDFGGIFIDGTADNKAAFDFLLRKTIGCGRFSVKLKNCDFRYPAHGASLHGFPHWNRLKVWRVLRKLKDTGLVHFDYKQDGRYDHIINIPGMILRWRQMHGANGAVEFIEDGNIRSVLDAAEKEFRNMGFSFRMKKVACSERFNKISEGLKHGFEQSERALERKKQKRQETENMKPKQVLELMEDYCKELGVSYFGGFESETDRKRAMGSCKNFLSYCEREGLDAAGIKNLLYSVCSYWYEFRSGVLAWEGKKVELNIMVSFKEFFTYRDQIIGWVGGHTAEELRRSNMTDEEREPKHEVIMSH